MTADLAVRDDTAPLALRPGQEMFDAKQRAALTAMGVSKTATTADLAVFAHVCQRTQLDPFTRQIYMIERREKQGDQWVTKQTIQVGIDGFRVIRDRVAERTGCEVELEDTVWYDAEGREHSVWLSAEAPAACRVVLIKHSATGRPLRYPAVLRTAAYIQMKNGQPVSQWRTQPDHMIEKCCEAFATRRAFPNDFSGVYLEEEMNGPRGDERDQRPAHRSVTMAQVIPGHAEPEPAAAPEPESAQPAEPEPPQSGSENEKPVTAQEVNARFKELGFGVKDKDDVLAAAAAFCDRTEPVKALADLTPEELAGVAYRLSGCTNRDEVTELHALIVESQGGSGEPEDGEPGE